MHTYKIRDSNFICDVEVKPKGTSTNAHIQEPAAIIFEYRSRGLPIVSNLVKFYIGTYDPEEVLNYAEEDCIKIDKYYPAWKYGADIYPEIVQKIKTLLLLG